MKLIMVFSLLVVSIACDDTPHVNQALLSSLKIGETTLDEGRRLLGDDVQEDHYFDYKDSNPIHVSRLRVHAWEGNARLLFHDGKLKDFHFHPAVPRK